MMQDNTTNTNREAISEDKIGNHLVNESSPYLLQHAYNPVDWHPWSQEALEKAKAEDKLVVVSIGYAACHWCHVMEHESFEDEEVAKIMNESFISIKVDREERPDIDQIYMDAVQLLTGQGGWPLNAFILPDGRPIHAGTYFPKNQWIQTLAYLRDVYDTDKEKVLKQAASVTEGVNSLNVVGQFEDLDINAEEQLAAIWNNWRGKIDFNKGGRAGAPKFPMPSNYEYLLRYYQYSQNPKVLDAITITLDNMAKGGIYDHIGGGFARYSVDGDWHVPHFEKMLYDNGQLVSLYAKAYQLTKDERYERVIEETLEWVKREMTSPENGFYSSLDADSQGEEGKFYVWSKEEIDSLLGDDAEVFNDYFGITGRGNWEHHKNIPDVDADEIEVASRHGMGEDDLMEIILRSKSILLKEREKRIRPGLDDKILTSWNALMLIGYVDAYRALYEHSYLEAAIANANFIVKNCLHDGERLTRNYKNGKATINAFLIDYALTIEAFIALYEATFDENWLQNALTLTEYTLKHFYDEQKGFFYYTSDLDPALITRKIEKDDNVIVSSNSAMARNLYTLSKYFYRKDLASKAGVMSNIMTEYTTLYGPFYSNWAYLFIDMADDPYEIAIVGEEAVALRLEFDYKLHTNAIFLGGEKEGTLPLLENKMVKGQTTIYVCKNKTCQLPVTSVDEALKQML